MFWSHIKHQVYIIITIVMYTFNDHLTITVRNYQFLMSKIMYICLFLFLKLIGMRWWTD